MSARLTVREFARRASCDEKQVRRALEKGALTKGEDGLLAESDVGGQWRKPNRRGVAKIAAAGKPAPVRTTANVRAPADKSRRGSDVRSETPEQVAERLVAERPLLTLNEALQLKENYLARHQQLAYDLKAASVVLIADVAKAVGSEYATVRKKLLAIPSEQAPALLRVRTAVEVEDLLRSVISEALGGLTLDQAPGA